MPKKHTHRPVNGSVQGYGSGTVPPPCRHAAMGRACNTGTLYSFSCRCGATGAQCHEKRIHWIPRQED